MRWLKLFESFRNDFYKSVSGLENKYIRYALDWENLETISELADNDSLIYKVRLEFFSI